jgi:FHS family L-fucose permease-like MFS transporter
LDKQQTDGAYTLPFVAVTTLFFAWGFITSLVDPLVAAVKGIFDLTDVEAQLSASAFFVAYGVLSLPAAWLIARVDAASAILTGLVLMGVGCLVMLAAANTAYYELVLFGLFVLASGITILQVAANPLAAALGALDRSHLRLTISQTFNSLGTFIGPYIGASLFLKGLELKHVSGLRPEIRSAALAGIDRAFVWIAGLILLLTLYVWFSRKLVASASPVVSKDVARRGIAAIVADALSSRWAVFGGVAIFLYVGAEVAIGTQMALLLNSDSVLNISLERAGKMVSFYWGGAMIGRILGSLLLTRVNAASLLAVFTAAAFALCILVFLIDGPTAGYAALSIGLFNSIMFPIIFTLTLERSTASREATSGLLCFAIIGGAALPPVVGLVSQNTSYSAALLVPAICYALLFVFAISARRWQADRPHVYSQSLG